MPPAARPGHGAARRTAPDDRDLVPVEQARRALLHDRAAAPDRRRAQARRDPQVGVDVARGRQRACRPPTSMLEDVRSRRPEAAGDVEEVGASDRLRGLARSARPGRTGSSDRTSEDAALRRASRSPTTAGAAANEPVRGASARSAAAGTRRAAAPPATVASTRRRRRDWRSQVESTTGERRANRRRTPGHPSIRRVSEDARPCRTTRPPARDPRRPQARRRPLRLRAVEGPTRADRASRRRRDDGHGDLAPPEAGQGGRRPRPRRARRPVRLPEGYEVALGNGGTTAFWDAARVRPRPRPRAAPDLRRVLREVRQGHAGRAVPRRTRSSSRPSPATRPRRAPTRRRRRRRLGAQRDLDRRDGPRRAPEDAGDALVLIDATSGAGGLPLDASQADVYYFAPQKSLRRRRRPVARAAEPAPRSSASPRSRRRRRWVPEFLSLATALENSRKDQTYNTPAVATLLLLADQVEWMLEQRRPGLGVARTTDVLEPPLRLGRGDRSSRRRSWPTRPSARSSSARSTSTRRSTPPRVAATLRANGIVDMEPYRKLGRNQLRVGDVPGDRARRRRGAHRVHRLGRGAQS